MAANDMSSTKKIIILLAVVLAATFFYAYGKADYDNIVNEYKGTSASELKRKGDRFLKEGLADSALTFYTLTANKYRSGMNGKDVELCSGALNNAGYIYMLDYYNYPQAYICLLKALDLAEEAGCKGVEACAYLNIGNIYAIYDDCEAALKYYKKSFYAAIEAKDYHNLLTVFANMVVTAMQENRVGDVAEENAVFSRLDIPQMPMLTYAREISRAAGAMTAGDATYAISCLRKAIASVDTDLTPERFRLITQLLVAIILDGQGHTRQAISELVDAEGKSGKEALDIQEQAARLIVGMYRKIHRADSVMIWQERQLALKDSIFSNQQYSRIRDLDTSFEISKIDTRLKQSESRRRTTAVALAVTVGFTAVVLVLAVLILQKNRRLNRQNHDLYRRNTEVMRLNENESRMRTAYERRIAECEDKLAQLAQKEEETQPQRKQRTSGMDEETGQRLLEKIGRVTNDISEISKNEFSIDRLAKLVGSNSHYVSKVINDYYGKNFATLLGEARVGHACKMLCDMGTYGNMTIETIAQELGFKSRSNFVTVFKKITGLTPSEYRKINREVEGVKA